MKDAYRQKILERLESSDLDGNVFEACAADLLREVFPGLVPIRGGSDAGMDGAVADGDGQAFPLVCTTGQDVIGNLRGSLDSYLRAGRPRRKAVLATSQTLTPQQRRNVEDAAQEKGFTLLQIIEREGMADRLYHSPRWCKELLGLASRPSALASVPDSRRPLFEVELIGRDKDIEWLRQTEGDRIVAGEPGSGKTFLLYKYAQEVGALFLVRSDEEAIASALLKQQPSIVIVDDAHVHLEQLDLLRNLRQIRGHNFSILAASWKGDEDSVAEALGTLPEAKSRRLELLTRKELVEVYRQAGIEERDVGADVLRELVTQASNKPGLAVMIATLWHQGAWQEVFTGEALRKSLVPQLKEQVGDKAVPILAGFALGGDQGFTMERLAKAEFLDGLSHLEIRAVTVGLAFGGVLAERLAKRLAVQPPVLRSALLREVFFSGRGTDLPWRDLMAKPEEDEWSYRSSVEAIVQAAHVGAEIPPQELLELVNRAGRDSIWRELAYLDEAAAERVLASFPGDLERIASSTLYHAPNATVAKLLRKAEADDEQDAGGRSRPLEMLSSWLQETFQVGEPLHRRRVVIQEARKFLAKGGATAIGYRALILALSPSLSTSHTDPGRGDQVTFTRGLLSIEDLHAMDSLWQDVRPVLTDPDAISWHHLRDVLWHWRQPGELEGSDELKAIMHQFVRKVLLDLQPMAENKPWIAAELADQADEVGLRLDLLRAQEFERLYPSFRKRHGTEADEALQALARDWKQRTPQDVAQQLATFRRGAEAIGRGTGASTEFRFSRFLAAEVEKPEAWLAAFVESDLPQSFLRPLLEVVVQAQRPDWEGWLRHFLREERLRWIGLPEILALPEPPEDLLKEALAVADSWTLAVEQVCLTREASIPVLRALLTHPSWEVALNAAVGEWNSDKGRCRNEIAPEWRAAVLRSATENLNHRSDHSLLYWLRHILAAEPGLAQNWIQERLKSSERGGSLAAQEVLSSAVQALSEEQRKALMTWWAGLEPREAPRRFLSMMVDRSPSLYRHLLQQNLDRRWLLEPLVGKPNDKWPDLVEAALEAGFEPREIAAATFAADHSWAGSGISYWTQWDQAFAAFEEHSREEVRATVREGRRRVQARIDEAHEEERQTELHGLG